jgi:hypothetical protein
MTISRLRRWLICPLQMCGFVQRDNETHIWGECLRCGKVSGKVSREAIRRYAEARDRDQRAVTTGQQKDAV